MSLDGLRSFHFHNGIMKSVNIESIEYCYLIPIVAKLADYWGDVKMTCLCKIMSRQVKEHLIHASYLHFLLSSFFSDASFAPVGSVRSRTGSVKFGQLQDCLIFENKIENLVKSIKKRSLPNCGTECPTLQGGDKIASYLSCSRSFSSEWSEMVGLLGQKNPKRGGLYKQEFEDLQLANPYVEIFPYCIPALYKPFAVDCKIKIPSTWSSEQEKSMLLNLHKLDKSFFQLVNSIIDTEGQKNKIGNSTSGKAVYLLLLQILRDRKLWKAEQWYPFVYTSSLKSHLFPFLLSSTSESFDLSTILFSSKSSMRPQKDLRYKIEKSSRIFFQFSQSEKQMSQLIPILNNQ